MYRPVVVSSLVPTVKSQNIRMAQIVNNLRFVENLAFNYFLVTLQSDEFHGSLLSALLSRFLPSERQNGGLFPCHRK